ncbi:MAG TPA: hypothetical protein VL978_16405 [Puia sp.]|nr:hypothetical protein [Puia sp.]
MSNANYSISFSFAVDAAKMRLTLEAEVEEHHSKTYYVVSNFRIPGHGDRIVLPPITIQKEDGVWVHKDSGKPTDLSAAAGRAIDELKLPAFSN